jgi:hypothetical protein
MYAERLAAQTRHSGSLRHSKMQPYPLILKYMETVRTQNEYY